MIKELMKSIREYKRDSILTPILVSLEVVMECIIPFVVAQLVNEIKAGSGMGVISRYRAGKKSIAADYYMEPASDKTVRPPERTAYCSPS